MIYRFSKTDLDIVTFWAKKRYNERVRKGHLDQPLSDHWIGTLGEYAAHKHFNLPWTGRFYETSEEWEQRKINREYDVGPLEIRAINTMDKNLPLYAKDWLEAPFVLVLCQQTNNVVDAKFLGWIYGYDGMKVAYDKGNWFKVLKGHLRSMNDPEFSKIIRDGQNGIFKL